MISVIQNGDSYDLKFAYDPYAISIVKTIPGRFWDKNRKVWTIPSNRLGFLMNAVKDTPYENQLFIQSNEHLQENQTLDTTTVIPDVDISNIPFYVEEGSKPFNHQLDFMKYAIHRQLTGKRSGFLLADQQGCISGDAIVRIKEEGKLATRETSLRNLTKLFSKDNTIKIKSMVNGRFGYMPMRSVICTGIHPTIKITLEDTSLRCTPDHLIYTKNGWVRADRLSIGSEVMTNGQMACKLCGSTEDLVTYPYAKFLGYCRSCMYKGREGTVYKGNSTYREIDEDGYVRLRSIALRYHPLSACPENNGRGLLEHHLVWYEHTGHIIDTSREVIHHKNQIKTDNRFENLELMTIHEHDKLHSETKKNHLPQYNVNLDFIMRGNTKVYLVPRVQKVTKIESCAPTDVYDVSIDDDTIHNFICNNVVVHNCGKTIEVLNLAMYNKATRHSKHCLVICCVNSAKYNWKADVFKHTNGKEDPYILGTRMKKDKIHFRCDTGSIEKLEDLRTGHMYSDPLAPELPYFIVVNIEAFRYKVGKLYMFTKEVIKYINDGLIDMIAIDEIHKNASPSSIQGKQLLEIKKQCTRAIEWIPMTGTPITSKPTDLYLPLKLVDAHQYSNFYSWENRFCIKGGFGDKEIVGYKNMPLLKGMLQDNMIRRLKQDVLDLPDKIYYTEYVENTSTQKALYEKLAQELKRNRDLVVQEMNPLARFMKLRQVNGSPELIDDTITIDSKYLSKNAKLSKLLELLDDAISEGEKVIVFSNWVEPLRTLYRFVSKKYKTCCYTGTMSPDAREQHKQAFINNPDYKVMIGTIGALGTSHTLTVASTIIFYDECWNPSDREQAEDRVHRIGAKFPVKIKTIITKDTVDERVHDILSKKESIANYIVDDSLDIYKNPKLFDLLLSDTIVKK